MKKHWEVHKLKNSIFNTTRVHALRFKMNYSVQEVIENWTWMFFDI